MRDRWLIGIFLLRWGVWPVVVVVEAGLSNLNLMVWIDSLLGARLSETRLSREALELGTPIGRSRRKVEVEVEVDVTKLRKAVKREEKQLGRRCTAQGGST